MVGCAVRCCGEDAEGRQSWYDGVGQPGGEGRGEEGVRGGGEARGVGLQASVREVRPAGEGGGGDLLEGGGGSG